MVIEIGAEIEGKITGLKPFGAFVELAERKVGLVHISQVAENYVTDINQHLHLGDVVKVKVLSVSKEGKFDLSIKQVGKAEGHAPPRRMPEQDFSRAPRGSFEDKITQFLKQSEEKLSDWKNNIDTKHGIKKRKVAK